MARNNGLALIVISLVVGVLTTIFPTGVESIGVCYGTKGEQLPQPSDVIKMYQSNGIDAMRLYAPNDTILIALKGSGIHVMMGVNELTALATDASFAPKWVNDNIKPYPQVSFKYIVVGNEIPEEYAHYILPAMNKMWDAICSAGLEGKIKISTALKFDVFTNTYPPSNSEFNPSYNMGPIVQFLAETHNPLFVNIYPYFSHKDNPAEIKLEYALFTASGTQITDGSFKYQNLFDAMVDSVYYALQKAGYPNVGVVVSETGWPSAGGVDTTVPNAQTYNQNLINHVNLSTGTPKKKGNLETYIFAMFNEKNKEGDEVERHFGLFYPNKTPVYPITFKYDPQVSSTDQGRLSRVTSSISLYSFLLLIMFSLFPLLYLSK